MMKSSNPSQSKTDIPIPEPRHRVGPKGVSSGISFRNLPPPSLDEIKKVCEHYQEKCSGTYKSLASRYVYQMATEIEDLVDVMQGESSGSEASFPKKRFHRPGADKENATQVPRCEKLGNETQQPMRMQDFQSIVQLRRKGEGGGKSSILNFPINFIMLRPRRKEGG
jgi:hypothetical protein